MAKARFAVHATDEPDVVVIEVVVPANEGFRSSFERLFMRHETRCVYSYVVRTSRHTILRAKIARLEGKAIGTTQMTSLLEDIRAQRGQDSSPVSAPHGYTAALRRGEVEVTKVSHHLPRLPADNAE